MPPLATWVIRGASLGAERGDGDDRGDDDVDRDDVDRALGNAGELLQQSAGVAEDDRLGHAEAADPPGERLGERRLDDRRAARSRPARCPSSRSAPARRAPWCTRRRRASRRWRRGPGRPRRAGPSPSLRACSRSWRRAPGAPAAPSSLRASLRKWTSLSGWRLMASVSLRRRRAGGDLLAPVEAEVERAVADELLGRVAAAVAGHVAGADGDQVRGDVQRRSTCRRCGSGRAG